MLDVKQMQVKKRDPLTFIKSSRIGLMMKLPFFPGIIMKLTPQEAPWCNSGGVHTMATDGKNLFYHPDILEKNSVFGGDNTLMPAAVLHEVLHCVFTHGARKDKRDHLIWNIACDYAINGILMDMGFKIGQQWFYNEKYKNLSADVIYKDLIKNAKKIPKTQIVFDMHMPMDGKWKQGQNQGQEQGEGIPVATMQPGGGTGKEDDKKKGASGVGGDKSDKEAQAQAEAEKKLAGEWKKAFMDAVVSHGINNKGKGYGTLPGAFQDLIEEIKTPDTSIVSFLSDFITKVSDAQAEQNWKRARMSIKAATGRHWPTIENKGLNLVIVADSSGSVSNADAGFIFGIVDEVMKDLPVCALRYMEVDAEIKKDAVYYNKETPEFKITGRGGTNFQPVFTRLKEEIEGNAVNPVYDAGDAFEPHALIYITDGEGPFPKEQPDFPVIWAINHKGLGITPPWGEVVRFDDNDVKQRQSVSAGQNSAPGR